jgi:F-type H+-transporting ATPase subunit b
VELYTIAAAVGAHAARLAADSEPLFQINLFQVIVAALNFVVFLVLMWTFAFKPISAMLSQRRERIEQGLKDAEQARADRQNAEQERLATVGEARREANDILARAQKVAQETRDADIAATREELERLRARATEDIAAEKGRALSELRTEVADLALRAAGVVVGESMTGDRQRRLVEEFLAGSGAGNGKGAGDGKRAGEGKGAPSDAGSSKAT